MRRMLFSAVLGMGISISVLHAQSPLPADRTITIMPLGDSITEGGSTVYRYPLMEKLLAAGFDVKYVGSKTTRPLKNSPLGQLPHEGYSGIQVGGLDSLFVEIYTKNPADIILIHAGHNQFSESGPVPAMLKHTRSIIEKAREINPNVVILLAQVIPSGKLPKYSYIPEFNEELVALAGEFHSPDRPVILVNQAEGFDWQTDTGGDQVHPNARGAEKMAQKWFDALRRILPAPAVSSKS